MTELDDYKRAMRPDQPEPMCVRLCATVARLREENERLRAQLQGTRSSYTRPVRWRTPCAEAHNIVRAVAGMQLTGTCPFCGADVDWDEPTEHGPDCAYVQAVRLTEGTNG